MTLEEVKRRVEEIRAAAHDDERAHGMEDELWGDVLAAVADGAHDARKLAAAALATSALDFGRWCA